MELIRFDINETYNLPTLVVALGHFDGLHLAHQALINEVVEKAKVKSSKSAIITFDPHPDYVLGKRNMVGYLTPLTDKVQKLASFGLDYVIIIPFTKSLSELSYENFELQVLRKFKISHIVVGFDYRYGRKGEGNPSTLKANYELTIIPKIEYDHEKIGSSTIRDFLENGEMEKVKELLGSYYKINGKVIAGNQLGRTFGVRTANISFSNEYFPLKIGVYVVRTSFKERNFLGIANFGYKPTVGGVSEATLEVHIIDFEGNLYGEDVSVEFIAYIREEVKFSSINELAKQIKADMKIAKEMQVEL